MKINIIFWLIGGATLIVLYGLFDPASYFFPPCPIRMLTGWLCPGCGSQRALHQALHGNFAASFELNSLFLPAILYGAVGFLGPYIHPERWLSVRNTFFGLKAAYIALAVILIFWIGRNLI